MSSEEDPFYKQTILAVLFKMVNFIFQMDLLPYDCKLKIFITEIFALDKSKNPNSYINRKKEEWTLRGEKSLYMLLHVHFIASAHVMFFPSPLSSIYKVHDEAKDKAFELEMSWVCDESNRQHQKVISSPILNWCSCLW